MLLLKKLKSLLQRKILSNCVNKYGIVQIGGRKKKKEFIIAFKCIGVLCAYVCYGTAYSAHEYEAKNMLHGEQIGADQMREGRRCVTAQSVPRR